MRCWGALFSDNPSCGISIFQYLKLSCFLGQRWFQKCKSNISMTISWAWGYFQIQMQTNGDIVQPVCFPTAMDLKLTQRFKSLVWCIVVWTFHLSCLKARAGHPSSVSSVSGGDNLNPRVPRRSGGDPTSPHSTEVALQDPGIEWCSENADHPNVKEPAWSNSS